MKIAGSTVFVTGANRGLGRCLVEELLRRDARRIYAGTRDLAAIAPVVALDPARVLPIVVDVTDEAQVTAAAAAAADVTLVLSNAGTLRSRNLLSNTLEQLRLDMEVNFWGTLRVARAFVPALERNGGEFVSVLSVGAWAGMPSMGGYCASKAASWSMLQSLRAELGPRGVHVRAAFPGGIRTDMTREVEAPLSAPEDIAHELLAGVEADEATILTDPMSRAYYPRLGDREGLEREFGMY